MKVYSPMGTVLTFLFHGHIYILPKPHWRWSTCTFTHDPRAESIRWQWKWRSLFIVLFCFILFCPCNRTTAECRPCGWWSALVARIVADNVGGAVPSERSLLYQFSWHLTSERFGRDFENLNQFLVTRFGCLVARRCWSVRGSNPFCCALVVGFWRRGGWFIVWQLNAC